MSQENVELVRRVVDSFNRRDLDAALALVHSDAEFGSRIAAMEGGYHGHEGIRRWWRTILDASPDRTIEIVEVRDLGDLTLTRARARGHGGASQIPYEETVWSVARWRGKKAVWWAVFPTKAEALEAAGLRERAMSDENVELVRRAYDSFNRWAAHPERGPLPDDPPLLHPEVEFHTYATSPEAGIYRGPDAVIEYNQRLFEQFESVRIELEDVVPVGDRVLVTSRQHAIPKGGETAMVVEVVEVYTIRDGLLAVRQSFPTRAEALEAVGLRE